MESKIDKGEKYLPVGSVVLLKGGEKRIMITGFCVTRKDKPDEIWDYSGCLYPEGTISPESTLLFDHSQITEVYYLGLIDDEEKEFKKKLVEKMKERESE